jgi:hypothetical protein
MYLRPNIFIGGKKTCQILILQYPSSQAFTTLLKNNGMKRVARLEARMLATAEFLVRIQT